MRADRLLAILAMLKVYKQVTTRELAERLEVSERTIHRDMEALSAAGVPVYAHRGKQGGWRLTDDAYVPLSLLIRPELSALFLQVPDQLLRDLGMDKEAELAALKLLAALPEPLRSDADTVRQRIWLDPSGWHPRDEPTPRLPLLQQAVFAERKLRIRYLRVDNTAVERLVEPLGLVAKGSVWYLVARADDDIRTYRASRVQEAVITDERFQRPAGFDLAAFWSASSRSFVERLPRYEVTVRAHVSLADQLGYAGRFPQIRVLAEADESGWMTLSLVFQVELEARAYVLGFGERMEVLEPAELRETVRRLAEEVMALYDGGAAGDHGQKP